MNTQTTPARPDPALSFRDACILAALPAVVQIVGERAGFIERVAQRCIEIADAMVMARQHAGTYP